MTSTTDGRIANHEQGHEPVVRVTTRRWSAFGELQVPGTIRGIGLREQSSRIGSYWRHREPLWSAWSRSRLASTLVESGAISADGSRWSNGITSGTNCNYATTLQNITYLNSTTLYKRYCSFVDILLLY